MHRTLRQAEATGQPESPAPVRVPNHPPSEPSPRPAPRRDDGSSPHLPPPFGRASSRLPARLGHKAQSPHFPPPIRTTCDAPTAVRPRSTSTTRSKFQSRSCEESTANGRCWLALRIAPGEHDAGNQNLVADFERADFFFD